MGGWRGIGGVEGRIGDGLGGGGGRGKGRECEGKVQVMGRGYVMRGDRGCEGKKGDGDVGDRTDGCGRGERKGSLRK